MIADKIKDNGYAIIKNVLTDEEVMEYRDLLDSHFSTAKTWKRENRPYSGNYIPGWAGITPELGRLNMLHKDERIISILTNIFNGRDFRFLNHSDLHQDVSTDWHRDANDLKRGGYDGSLWKEGCFIVKVCFLLQDHTKGGHGLCFRPRTHLKGISSPPIHADSASTDLIVFDQRIMHKGQDAAPFYHTVFNNHRYFLSFGYGLDNDFSSMHAKGCTRRQDEQRRYMK
tara:strand:+ start:15281 stop:15964 length:684 start_codon:yes stop_codon:yes gene_type:complete